MTVRRGPSLFLISLLAAHAPAQMALIEPDLAPIANVESPTRGSQQTTIEKIDQILTVEWRRKTILPRENKVIFSEGVVARYGPTVLYANTLTISQKEGDKRGIAEGAIRLEDPDGNLSADYLEFNWESKIGQAQNVVVDIDGLHIEARQADLKREEWVFTDVVAAPDGSKDPLVRVRTPSITYRPGQAGTARRPSLYLFGAKVITLPSYRFGAKRQEQVLSFPSISYSQGLGISWRTAVPIDDRSRFNGSLRAKAGEGPGISAQVVRSFLPRNEPQGIISPISELNERFTYGYFDNVYVKSPAEERTLISARRGSAAVGLTVNELANGRLNRDLYTKSIDVVFEQARPFGDFGFYSSLRYSDIREEGGTSENRIMASVTTLMPQLDFGGGLKSHARVETNGYTGDRNQFGWIASQFGLVYEPFSTIRVGGTYFVASEFGKPTFVADRLFSKSGYHLRLDADFGTTQFSYLAKYDDNRKKWYDNEFSITQTIGSIMPFVSYREFPRSFTFGVKLRAEETLNRIAKRFGGK